MVWFCYLWSFNPNDLCWGIKLFSTETPLGTSFLLKNPLPHAWMCACLPCTYLWLTDCTLPHSHQQICFTSTRLWHQLWLISCGIIISIPAQCLLSSFQYKFFFYCQAIKYVLFTDFYNKRWNSTVKHSAARLNKQHLNYCMHFSNVLLYIWKINIYLVCDYIYNIYLLLVILINTYEKKSGNC